MYFQKKIIFAIFLGKRRLRKAIQINQLKCGHCRKFKKIKGNFFSDILLLLVQLTLNTSNYNRKQKKANKNFMKNLPDGQKKHWTKPSAVARRRPT